MKFLLDKLNKKPAEFARDIKLSKSTMSQVLHGNLKSLSKSTLELINTKFNVHPNYWDDDYDGSMFALGGSIVDRQYNRIPIVGTVNAGKPLDAIENIEGYIDLNYDMFAPDCNCIATKMIGESMTGAGIHNDDLIIIRMPENKIASVGEISSKYKNTDILVVKERPSDGMFIGRVFIHKNKIELKPENMQYGIREYSNERKIIIIGKIVGLLRKYR